MSNWRDFWNSDHPIYVNDRHRQLHSQLVARAIIAHIPYEGAVVLDHGCGEALGAHEVARHCGRLYLCDAAPRVRAGLAERDIPNVTVLAPEDVPALPDASLDLVVANSLCQYLTRQELLALLDLWRDKLKPTGRLILADIIPHGTHALEDALALMRFAWRGGFVAAALTGLVRTAFSDYRRLRKAQGLTQYGEAEMLALLEEAQFVGSRLPRNLGHDEGRMAFAATPVLDMPVPANGAARRSLS